jgi:hypothetical protein
MQIRHQVTRNNAKFHRRQKEDLYIFRKILKTENGKWKTLFFSIFRKMEKMEDS